MFFFPAAAHTEKAGSFTNTNRMLQWHFPAVEPEGDARSDLVHVPPRAADSRKTRELPRSARFSGARSHLGLSDRRSSRGAERPSGSRRNQRHRFKRQPLVGLHGVEGRRLDRLWVLDLLGSLRRWSQPSGSPEAGTQQNWLGGEWGWAWPANRRILYNRASADPDGKPWSERKALVWWDESARRWTGHDVPDFVADKMPTYRAPRGAKGPDGIGGDEPFIMQADGRGWLYVPVGLADRPMPTHYEPEDSPSRMRCTANSATRRGRPIRGRRIASHRAVRSFWGHDLSLRRHDLPADGALHRWRNDTVAAVSRRTPTGVLL